MIVRKDQLIVVCLLPCAAIADIRFHEPSLYPTGGGTTGVFAADFDGDGDIDFATSDRYTDSVTIYYNDGLGVFENITSFSTGENPRYVEGNDFDGDGDIDLCTPDFNSSTITILENDGMGQFSMSQQFEMFTPSYLWIDDLDLDGFNDIITLHWDEKAKGEPHQNPGLVAPLYSNGDGTFDVGETVFVGVQPRGGDSADLNNDGLIDVVVADIYSRTISIVLSNGPRSWDQSVQISMWPGTPRYVELGDFDGDQDIDIAALDKLGGHFWILKNDGNANFILSQTVEVNDAPHSMEIVDADDDGDLDFIVTHVNSDTQFVLYNDGTGHIESMQGLVIEGGPAEIKIVDLNADGLFDIVSANVNSGDEGASVLIQKACIVCVSGELCPPNAYDLNVVTDSFTSIDIQLLGDSVNGNELDYIITSLPDNGVLRDMNSVLITSVPYFLIGDAVQFVPTNGDVGQDTFNYFVNDCELSNVAEVTVQLNHIYPDECNSSFEVFNGYTEISTLQATDSPEPNDPSLCNSTNFGELRNDIWLKYYACESGSLLIDTCGLIDFDVDIAVYYGDCCGPIQIACSGESNGCNGSTTITIPFIESGFHYFIRIGGATQGAVGSGLIYIDGPSVDCVQSCHTDINYDGLVGVTDVLFIIGEWGSSCGPADLNIDGNVDVTDLLAVIGTWGPCIE